MLISRQERAETIDLQNVPALAVDISDALSEQDKIKFTVHTKVRRSKGTLLVERRFLRP